MHTKDCPFSITLDYHEDTVTAMDWEAIDFSRLVHIVDDVALIRLGLILLERVAQAEGRILWH
jgi:hypothetical protein